MANVEPVLSIGRAGRDVAMAHPTSISWRSGTRGRQLTISGYLKDTATLADALTLRDQLTRQVKDDRQDGLIALHSDLDPSIDGYFILDSASVNGNFNLGSYQSTGHFTYSATLTEQDTQLFESILDGAELASDVGFIPIPVHTYMWAPPAGFTHYVGVVGSGNAQNAIRNIEADSLASITTFVEILPFTIQAWACPPVHFYEGAATLIYGGNEVLGMPSFDVEDLASGAAAPLSTGDWKLTNGMFRVLGQNNSDLSIAIEMWNGSTWESTFAFEPHDAGTAWTGTWKHLTVIRNNSHEVAIRLTTNLLSTGFGIYTLDLSLRRGFRGVRGILSSSSPSSGQGMKRTSTDAASSTTFGIEDAAADGNGNIWGLSSRLKQVKDLTNGHLELDSTLTGELFDFVLSFTPDSFVTWDTNHTTAKAIGVYYLSERVAPVLPGGTGL